jgi:signal transduction histidine kinase
MPVSRRISGEYRKLSASIEDELLRITQESLSNIERHAQASKAEVILQYAHNNLQLTIEDDGRGFVVDEGTAKSGHYGLKGIAERASTIGASLRIDSSPGAGTKVSLDVPAPTQK